KLLLELSGYGTFVAYNGQQALDVGARERPSAFILDVGMPDMTGYEVARRIRQQAWGRSTLLVAVTGWGQDDDKERAKAAGFDHHFTKPVSPEAVEQVLVSHLQTVHPVISHAAGGYPRPWYRVHRSAEDRRSSRACPP